jgi:N-carbamoylputrescine amidase
VLLGEASGENEETLVLECDRARLENTRRHWPFLRDRRIDSYGEIVRRLID